MSAIISGLQVAVFVLLGMVLIVVVGTVMCHCLCGQRFVYLV